MWSLPCILQLYKAVSYHNSIKKESKQNQERNTKQMLGKDKGLDFYVRYVGTQSCISCRII